MGQPYRYTGRRFDSETGLYYYRARYYSPVLGRFLQVDPVGYGDDLNLHAYVGNDPLNRVDPTGMYVDAMGNYYPDSDPSDDVGYNYNPLAHPGITATMMVAPLAAAAAPGVVAGVIFNPLAATELTIAAGEVGAGDALGGAAAGYTLYRVVDNAELADIVTQGVFRASPNGDSVKRFLDNLPDAQALKQKFEQFFGEAQTIVQGKASQAAMDAAERTPFNDVGRSMDSIAIPNNKLDQVQVPCKGPGFEESC